MTTANKPLPLPLSNVKHEGGEKQTRKRKTTDLGRTLLSRERQKLAREQAILAEQQAEEAKRMLAIQKLNKRTIDPIDAAVQRGLIRQMQGVLHAEGLTQPIHATTGTKTMAYTDFHRIVVRYRLQDDIRMLSANLRGLVYHEGGHCRWTIPFADLADLAGITLDSTTRTYHLAWNCLEDQRMETAVTSDSPRKAAYLTTMVLQDMVQDVNAAAANWPLLVWRKYLPKRIRSKARQMFVAKHTAMGTDGEALARRFERVTRQYVLADNAVDMWNAVVEYHSLLQATQPLAADMSNAGHRDMGRRPEQNLDDYLIVPVAGGMDEGEGSDIPVSDEGWPVDEDGWAILTPEQAQHLGEMFHQLWWNPETLMPVIYASTSASQSDDESEGGAGSISDKDDKPKSSTPSTDEGDDDGDSDEDADEADDEQGGDDADDDTDTRSNKRSKSRDDESDDDDRDGSDLDADSEYDDDDESYDDDDADDGYHGHDDDGLTYANETQDADDSDGGEDGKHKNTGVRDDLDYAPEDDDSDLTDEELAEALAEAEAERDADHNLDADVRAFQDAIDNRVSDLAPYNAGVSQDMEAQAIADNLAQDIEQAFQEATVDKAPGWLEQQRRGIVNVIRYETRKPGEVEFFRRYDDTDMPGTNIAVSVLLDYSGSMSSATKELAQAGYACKRACNALDIPCTVLLWDTDATVLWDANEYAEHLPVIVATGGTDISRAVADLDNQRFDKDCHIVIIMTDGAWSGESAVSGFLANYKGRTPGRYFMGLGYNSGYGSSESIAKNLRMYGCDEAHGIDDLMAIPRYLEQMLIAVS